MFKPIPGVGFGLGFAVIEDLPANGALGSAGTYYWAGAAGTAFWIDPVEDIVIVSMLQLMNPWFSYRKDLRVARYSYKALLYMFFESSRAFMKPHEAAWTWRKR